MAISRRKVLSGLGALLTVTGVGAIAKMGDIDMEPFAPKNDAEAIGDTFKYSQTGFGGRIYQMNSEYLQKIASEYENNPRQATVAINTYNQHTFEVRGGHVEADGKSIPVLALYDKDGEKQGMAMPYKANLTQDQIYEAAPLAVRRSPQVRLAKLPSLNQ